MRQRWIRYGGDKDDDSTRKTLVEDFPYMIRQEHACADLGRAIRQNGYYPMAMAVETTSGKPLPVDDSIGPKRSADHSHLIAAVGLRGSSIYGSSSEPIKKPLLKVTVGTDCTGIGTPIYALTNLVVNFKYEFASDIDESARKMIKANLDPKILYGDIGLRDNKLAPDCDVYITGFPCQLFSSAGLHQGIDDVQGRGKIIAHICNYLEEKLPRAFLLENVAALATIDDGKILDEILVRLSNRGEYLITWGILNTEEHGVPQHRPSLFICGIRSDALFVDFEWPQPIGEQGLEQFLDPRDPDLVANGLPPETATNARAAVESAIRQAKHSGVDHTIAPLVVDCDTSASWARKPMHDRSPCLTLSRNRGRWITNRGRRTNANELIRLQGMNPSIIDMCKRRQVRHANWERNVSQRGGKNIGTFATCFRDSSINAFP